MFHVKPSKEPSARLGRPQPSPFALPISIRLSVDIDGTDLALIMLGLAELVFGNGLSDDNEDRAQRLMRKLGAGHDLSEGRAVVFDSEPTVDSTE